jgi:hypothetical protein
MAFQGEPQENGGLGGPSYGISRTTVAFQTLDERTRLVTDNWFRWAALLSANLFLWGVLSFYESSSAAPPAGQAGQPPFANAVEQRHEIIRELQQIKTLLQEQNQLLRAAGRDDVAKKK